MRVGTVTKGAVPEGDRLQCGQIKDNFFQGCIKCQ